MSTVIPVSNVYSQNELVLLSESQHLVVKDRLTCLENAEGEIKVIPQLDHNGVLPPFVGTPTDSRFVSPYATSTTELARAFATTAARRDIFRGFLDYRTKLKSLGFTSCVQWLDGSYLEDCENQRNAPPQDIDVVTLAYRPPNTVADADWERLIVNNGDIFRSGEAKRVFRCDAYFIDLSLPDVFYSVKRATFYSSLFSHQRGTRVWKGMVELSLMSDDAEAHDLIAGGNL